MLSTQQIKFVDALTKGNNITDSAKISGYNRDYATQLLRKPKIAKALEKAGLTDNALANTIKTNIEAGTGVKATADTATKNVELALKLKGYLDKAPDPQTLTQTNVYINEMKQMTDKDLNSRLDELTKEVQKLK